MKCRVCGQVSAFVNISHCLTCGMPFDLPCQQKTILNAQAFYKAHHERGGARGWFELKTISGKQYLYARWKQDGITKSRYIGKATLN